MRAALDLCRERERIERAKFLSCLRLKHANEAGAHARQRDKRERTALSVKLGRNPVVRARVPEIERQRGLRVFVPRSLDTSGLAAERFPPVGPDDQLWLE